MFRLRKDGSSWKKAEAKGLKFLTIAEATKIADVCYDTLPDESQSEIYEKEIKPNLKDGAYLAFGHGFNIAIKELFLVKKWMYDGFQKLQVILFRSKLQKVGEIADLIAVHQDASGNTKTSCSCLC